MWGIKIICDTCGLPVDLCVCGEFDKLESIIKLKTDIAKWGKTRTILENAPEPKKLVKILKRLVSCGGTAKKGVIILQGNHVYEISIYLDENGYKYSKY